MTSKLTLHEVRHTLMIIGALTWLLTMAVLLGVAAVLLRFVWVAL
jgi:hypothetical protein